MSKKSKKADQQGLLDDAPPAQAKTPGKGAWKLMDRGSTMVAGAQEAAGQRTSPRRQHQGSGRLGRDRRGDHRARQGRGATGYGHLLGEVDRQLATGDETARGPPGQCKGAGSHGTGPTKLTKDQSAQSRQMKTPFFFSDAS